MPTLNALVPLDLPVIPAGAGELVRADPGDLQVNPAAVHRASQSERGRPGVMTSLRVAARRITAGQVEDPLLVDWSQVGFQHVAALVAALEGEGRRPAGVNHIRAAVIGVLKAAWQLGLIDSDRYLRARSVRRARGVSLPAGHEVEGGEVLALMKACAADRTLAGRRDAALLGLLFGTGIRRTPLTELVLADWDPTAGSLRVLSKGNKEHLVYPTGGARRALEAWLTARGEAPGRLFAPIDKAGRMELRSMSSQAVYKVCKKRAAEAGTRDFSPHDARRSFCTALLEAGADLAAVADLAAHSDLNTTRRYDRRGERAKRKVAELIHVPYVEPVD